MKYKKIKRFKQQTVLHTERNLRKKRRYEVLALKASFIRGELA
jgi:hypothetical protein